jgi:galactose mutarotase-like enzyme
VLMLWTKPNNAPYICVECWCNGPDFVDAHANIAEKPGFMEIRNGETITRTHTITFIK